MRWLLCVALALTTWSCDAPRRPNVVYIISDDQGFTDFGFMGSAVVQTPNIDRLARDGTTFTTGYVTTSTCQPSLASLLTGLDPVQIERRYRALRRAGVVARRDERLREFSTLPRVLGEHGYVSFQAGKLWDRDFAVAGFSAGTKGGEIAGNWLIRAAGGEAGMAIGRSTLQPVFDFVDEHDDQPFLLWLAPRLPHRPMDPPARFVEAYRADLSDAARNYYANITRLDESVGQLLEHLERRQLLDETLIVFLVDNGWDTGPQDDFRHLRFGGPKGKNSAHELGLRTPIVFHFPGVIPAGVRNDSPVSTLDVFPTVLEYAGVSEVPPTPGRSLRPVIEGRSDSMREYVVGRNEYTLVDPLSVEAGGTLDPEFETANFVRTRRWHYIWKPDSGQQLLFDLQSDADSSHDVSSAHPDRVAEFRRAIRRWESEIR